MAMQTSASGVPDSSTTTPSIRYAAPAPMSGVAVAGGFVGAIISTLPLDPIAISCAGLGSGGRVLTAPLAATAAVLEGEGAAGLPHALTSRTIVSDDARLIQVVSLIGQLLRAPASGSASSWRQLAMGGSCYARTGSSRRGPFVPSERALWCRCLGREVVARCITGSAGSAARGDASGSRKCEPRT